LIDELTAISDIYMNSYMLLNIYIIYILKVHVVFEYFESFLVWNFILRSLAQTG